MADWGGWVISILVFYRFTKFADVSLSYEPDLYCLQCSTLPCIQCTPTPFFFPAHIDEGILICIMMSTSVNTLRICRLWEAVDDNWQLITADNWTLFPVHHDDAREGTLTELLLNGRGLILRINGTFCRQLQVMWLVNKEFKMAAWDTLSYY